MNRLAWWLVLALVAGGGCFRVGEDDAFDPYGSDDDDDDDDDNDDDDDDNDDDDDDSGGDSDADGDSDGDSDADGDSDGDSDPSCDQCPLNSGYPCPCDQLGGEDMPMGNCDDGSTCGNFFEDGLGSCFRPCEDDSDCHPGFDCGGEGECVLMDVEENMYCAYICNSDSDCPADTECNFDVGLGVCYPPT